MDIGINEVQEIIKNLESSGKLSIKEEKYLKVAKLCVQLAAENVGPKAGIGEAYDEMEQLDDGYFSTDADGEPMDTLITLVDAQAAIQRLAIDIEIPATDRIVAEAEARGVEKAIAHLEKKFSNIGVQIMNLQWLADSLREGAK